MGLVPYRAQNGLDRPEATFNAVTQTAEPVERGRVA
jgi:hypothetical protein